jgi:hypothetical protein
MYTSLLFAMSHVIQKLLQADLSGLEARYGRDTLLLCMKSTYNLEEKSEVARLQKLNDDLCHKIQEVSDFGKEYQEYVVPPLSDSEEEEEEEENPPIRTIQVEHLSASSVAALDAVRALREELEGEKSGSESECEKDDLRERLDRLGEKLHAFKKKTKKQFEKLSASLEKIQFNTMLPKYH